VILRKIERQKMHIVLAIENNHMKLLIREGPIFDRHEEKELLEKAAAKGYTDVVELIHGKRQTRT
jgi:hypothetical protein